MANEFNAKRRHRIRKMKHRVRNWPEYEDGLRNRGSLTFWVTPYGQKIRKTCPHRVWATRLRVRRVACVRRAQWLPALV